MFTNTLLPGASRQQAPELTLEPYLNPLKVVQGAYLCLKTQHHFPCQISDSPISGRYGWLGLIIDSWQLLQTFYKISYLINICTDKMALSQLTFGNDRALLKQEYPWPQSVVSRDWICSVAQCILNQRIEILVKKKKNYQCVGCDFLSIKAMYFTEVLFCVKFFKHIWTKKLISYFIKF